MKNLVFLIIIYTCPLCYAFAPNAGDELLAGSTFPIQWETLLDINNVLIEYSLNDGTGWYEIATIENTGSYDWVVPFVESEECLIRISDASNPSESYTSDAVFTIYRCRNEMIADLDNDCNVNLQDFALFAQEWLECGNGYDGSCDIDLSKYEGTDLLAEYELGNWTDLSLKGEWVKQEHAFRIMPSPGGGSDFGWSYPLPVGVDTCRVIKRFKMSDIGAIQVVFTENPAIVEGHGVLLSYKWYPGLSVGDLTSRNDMTTVALPELSPDHWHELIIDVMPGKMIAMLDNGDPIEWNGSFTPTSVTISGDEYIDWYIQDLVLTDVPGPTPFHKESLDSNPGWVTTGQWEFGEPQGLGGVNYGNPDPAAGYTGSNVYGVNLAGDYSTSSGGPYTLTAGPFDCSGRYNVLLKYAQWLNTDVPDYMLSDIEVSNDNANWSNLWSCMPEDTCTDSEWQLMEYDISAVADNQQTVYVRWSYIVIIDRVFPYSGWNIDDIELWGTL